MIFRTGRTKIVCVAGSKNTATAFGYFRLRLVIEPHGIHCANTPTQVGVACVPGDNFYGKATDGERYLRFACCRSLSDIDAAVAKLSQALEG